MQKYSEATFHENNPVEPYGIPACLNIDRNLPGKAARLQEQITAAAETALNKRSV